MTIDSNELSDHKNRQMQSHYGGGKAHVFVHKDSKGGFSNQEEQQTIVALQQEYNKEIQNAIAFQARYTKGSKAWEKAEEKILDLKKQAGQLGIDLIKAETEARKKAAEEAERLAKQQLENYKAMLQAVFSVQQGIQGEADAIAKELAQLGMTPLQKAQDDFDRNVAKHAEKIVELRNKLAATNVNEEQHKAIVEEIAGLDKDILNLRTQQEQKMRVMYADETIKEYYEMHEDILKSEMRQVDAKKRKLSLETQLGQLNPEDRAKRLLEINHQELKVLERQKAIEAEKSTDILLSKDQQKAATERVLDLEIRISDVTNQQLLIAQELAQLRFQMSRQVQGEMLNALNQQLIVMGKMVGLSENLGTNFQNVMNSAMRISDALRVTTKGTNDKGEEIDIVSNANLLDALSVKNIQGKSGKITPDGIKGFSGNLSLDPTGVTAIIGVASQIKAVVDEMAMKFNNEFERVITGDIDALQNDAEAFRQQMIDIENGLTEARIQQAKERGEDTSQIELDFVRQRGQQELDELERQGEKILKTKTGFLGLEYTAEERQKRKQWYESVATKRKEIEERTNQQIEELRRQHLSVIMSAEQGLILATQNNHFDRLAFEASKTADPMDDIAAEEARRKTDSNRQWTNDLNAARDPALPLELQQQKEALANDAQRLRYEEIAKEMDDKRKKAKEGLNKARAEGVRLLELETAALRAQQTTDPYDDLYANADLELDKIRQEKEKALAEEGVTEEKKAKIREFYRQKELLARKNFEKALSDLKKSEVQRVIDDYKELLNQQKTLIQEELEVETEAYETRLEKEEAKLQAAENRVKAEQEKLEQLRKEKDAELKAFDPEDGVQSAQFRKDMANYNPDSAAYKGVDALSNVDNRETLDSVSPETRRKGLLEQAELAEMEAKNLLRKEDIDKLAYVKKMQEAQLMRAKAAEMELQTEGLTVRRRLELEGEWADAYQMYQDLARQAIDARYEAEEEQINKNIEKHQEQAAGYKKNIDDYQKAIDGLRKAAEDKIKPIEDAIKTADRSTRNWADAWTNVASGINAATAAMERQREAAQNGGVRVQATANQGQNYAQGTDGQKYRTTSDLFAALGASKMATGGQVPAGFPNDTYPALLSTDEIVIPAPLPLPTRDIGATNVFTTHVTVKGNHISDQIDMRELAREVAYEVQQEQHQNFGYQMGGLA